MSKEKLNSVEKDILLISLADYFVKCMNQENPLFDTKDILNTIRKVTILFDDEEVI